MPMPTRWPDPLSGSGFDRSYVDGCGTILGRSLDFDLIHRRRRFERRRGGGAFLQQKGSKPGKFGRQVLHRSTIFGSFRLQAWKPAGGFAADRIRRRGSGSSGDCGSKSMWNRIGNLRLVRCGFQRRRIWPRPHYRQGWISGFSGPILSVLQVASWNRPFSGCGGIACFIVFTRGGVTDVLDAAVIDRTG